VTLLGLAAACGPSAPLPATPTVAQAPPPAPPAPPVKTVRFALTVDGKPAGTEVWNVASLPDGSSTIDFESAVEGPRGKVSGQGRYAFTASHLPDSAEVTVRTPAEGGATFRLARSGADLTMTMERGGAADELKAGRPSNLFVPRPFFVGLAPVCALLSAKDPPQLVEFPGSAITILGKKTIGGAVVYTFDHGGLGRTILACDGDDVVAVLDPWTGQSAVRVDREDVGQALQKSIERTKPETPKDLTEEDVLVRVPAAEGDEEATLACSFLRPPGASAKGKLPAVVFATGSGPQDRDEDSAGRGGLKLSIFKEMAIALAEKGIASIRCDDRGTAKSTGTFDKATLGTFVRDALETLRSLSQRKDVDPTRLGFIGHSEGAVVGTLVAAKSGKLRALMLMAGPGRPLPEIGMLQEEAFLQQSGLPPEQIKRQLDAQRAVIDAIRAGKPLPDDIGPQHKEVIEKQRAWLKSHFDNDVQASLGKVPKMSVFVAQGGKDIQIPPEDADRVKAALAAGKNKEPLLKVYPELNHVFSVSHGGGITEYADADARVDATFLADTVDFFTRAMTR
jgi:pimeloyl-ACP methyl ester carboxylesterase